MYRTEVSCVIHAPIEAVWAIIRPFDSLSRWHPYVAACPIEAGQSSSQVGCIRRIELRSDGGVVRETLLELSDRTHTVVYDIIDSPMPVSDYVATLQLLEITEGSETFARWSVEFQTPAARREEMIEKLQDIFRTGLKKLDELMKQ